MHEYHHSDDFMIGEASYNVLGDSQTCPQVGCTVFVFKKQMRCVVDKLGGAVGTYYGDPRDVFSNDPSECNKVDAICLAGGSLNGLVAIAGVAQAMAKYNIDNDIRYGDGEMYKIPAVKGAITFSGAWGKIDDWMPPDANLGTVAYENALEGNKMVTLGQHGAGSNAEVGSIATGSYGAPGGQGAYCDSISYRTKVAGGYKFGEITCNVYCNLNSKGSIHGLDGEIMYNPDTKITDNQFRSTNILIHTNGKCKSMDLMRQLARQVHVSCGRVIIPYAAHSDGDVLFLTSSEEVVIEDPTAVGLFFSECLWKAVHSLAQHHMSEEKASNTLGFKF